jgi:AraC-like DNA-binding protein
MKYIPLVRVNNFLPFITFLDRMGSPTERWLEAVKLSSFALEDPESLIPRHLVFEFAQKAARAEGLENLGLLIGGDCSIANLGNFGQLICGSLTLYDALMTLQKIAPANNSGERYWLEVGNGSKSPLPADQAWFCMQHLGDANVLSRYGTQFALTLMVELLSLAGEKGWRPSEIYTQTRQPKTVSESKFFAGIKVQTGVGYTAIAFPRSFLSAPLRLPIAAGNRQNQLMWESLHTSAPSEDFPQSLQRAIVPLLRGGYPGIHLAADISGMSVRTLQRRLEAEGMTYSSLVKKARFNQAIRWLQNPSVQLVDVAAELGYSAPSHFSRAFKGWTSLSPTEFRRLTTENQTFLNAVSDQSLEPLE